MDTFTDILRNAVPLMIPVLLVALGEAVTEQSGVLNVGAEGVMLLGAFSAAVAFDETGSVVTALLISVPFGAFVGVVLAYLYVTRAVNQIAGGIMFVLLAIGLTNVLNTELVPSRKGTFSRLDIPLLHDIPVVGEVLFEQTIVAYAAIALAFVMYLLMRHTWFGVAIVGAGSNPSAVDSAGLSVTRLRYVSLVIGCLFASLGGAALVLTTTGSFLPGITSGLGFVALAVVVLGRWNPLWIVGGAALFGIARSLQFRIPTFGGFYTDVSDNIWGMLPYVVTIVVVIVAKGARYPAAIGTAFRREVSAT
jgi:simple sugar transport system permease protein